MFIAGNYTYIYIKLFIFFCSSLDLSDSNHIIDTSSTSIDCEQSSSFINPSLEDEVNGSAKNIDYRNFKFEMYVREYPWLYYNPVEKEYKCKYGELFPAVGSGNSKHKFGKEAVKSLTDHPHRFLESHKCSSKQQNSVKEYGGIYSR